LNKKSVLKATGKPTQLVAKVLRWVWYVPGQQEGVFSERDVPDYVRFTNC